MHCMKVMGLFTMGKCIQIKLVWIPYSTIHNNRDVNYADISPVTDLEYQYGYVGYNG